MQLQGAALNSDSRALGETLSWGPWVCGIMMVSRSVLGRKRRGGRGPSAASGISYSRLRRNPFKACLTTLLVLRPSACCSFASAPSSFQQS